MKKKEKKKRERVERAFAESFHERHPCSEERGGKKSEKGGRELSPLVGAFIIHLIVA